MMGKMLFSDYMENYAVTMLKSSDSNYGAHYCERAMVKNMEATAYIALKQFDSAELCLGQALAFAERGQYAKTKRKVLNNYAVLYRLQGKFEQAIEYHRQISEEPNLDATDRMLLYLNLGMMLTPASISKNFVTGIAMSAPTPAVPTFAPTDR